MEGDPSEREGTRVESLPPTDGVELVGVRVGIIPAADRGGSPGRAGDDPSSSSSSSSPVPAARNARGSGGAQGGSGGSPAVAAGGAPGAVGAAGDGDGVPSAPRVASDDRSPTAAAPGGNGVGVSGRPLQRGGGRVGAQPSTTIIEDDAPNFFEGLGDRHPLGEEPATQRPPSPPAVGGIVGGGGVGGAEAPIRSMPGGGPGPARRQPRTSLSSILAARHRRPDGSLTLDRAALASGGFRVRLNANGQVVGGVIGGGPRERDDDPGNRSNGNNGNNGNDDRNGNVNGNASGDREADRVGIRGPRWDASDFGGADNGGARFRVGRGRLERSGATDDLFRDGGADTWHWLQLRPVNNRSDEDNGSGNGNDNGSGALGVGNLYRRHHYHHHRRQQQQAQPTQARSREPGEGGGGGGGGGSGRVLLGIGFGRSNPGGSGGRPGREEAVFGEPPRVDWMYGTRGGRDRDRDRERERERRDRRERQILGPGGTLGVGDLPWLGVMTGMGGVGMTTQAVGIMGGMGGMGGGMGTVDARARAYRSAYRAELARVRSLMSRAAGGAAETGATAATQRRRGFGGLGSSGSSSSSSSSGSGGGGGGGGGGNGDDRGGSARLRRSGAAAGGDMTTLASQIAMAFDLPRGAQLPPESAVPGSQIRRDLEDLLKDSPVPRALAVCRVHDAVARALRDMGPCDLVRAPRFANVEVQHFRGMVPLGRFAGPAGAAPTPAGPGWVPVSTQMVGLPFSAGRLLARSSLGGSKHICVGRRTPSVSRYNMLVFGLQGSRGQQRYVVVDPGSQNGIRCLGTEENAPAFVDTARHWSVAVMPITESIYVELGGGVHAQVRVKITPVNAAGASIEPVGADAPLR